MKKVATTVPAETAPIGAERETKYPDCPSSPNCRYDSAAAGAK